MWFRMSIQGKNKWNGGIGDEMDEMEMERCVCLQRDVTCGVRVRALTSGKQNSLFCLLESWDRPSASSPSLGHHLRRFLTDRDRLDKRVIFHEDCPPCVRRSPRV